MVNARIVVFWAVVCNQATIVLSSLGPVLIAFIVI
jgi:hypothetical protein